MVRVARRLGADAALVATPPYNKPPQRSLIAHFRAVADEGGLPLVLYNVPGRTGCNLLPETACTLGEDPRFLAIKEAAGNLTQVEALVRDAPSGFSVLSGDDAMTLPMMALGAHGVISVTGNIATASIIALVDSARRNDFAAARAIHYRLGPLVAALFATTNPIPIKRAAAMLGHAHEVVRLPLTADAVDERIERALRAGLEHAGLV
jgi:4-hydroxy-tetrahydrodipicolinate synthase